MTRGTGAQNQATNGSDEPFKFQNINVPITRGDPFDAT